MLVAIAVTVAVTASARTDKSQAKFVLGVRTPWSATAGAKR